MTRRTVVRLGLIGIIATYAIQAPRPLHLTPDSVCYLLTAEVAAQGNGFDCAGCPPRRCAIEYPPGYPALVALLIRADLAGPLSFFVLNTLLLGVGMAAAYGILRLTFLRDSDTALEPESDTWQLSPIG